MLHQPPLPTPVLPDSWKVEKNPVKTLVRENLLHILERQTIVGMSRMYADLVGRLERSLAVGNFDNMIAEQERIFLSFNATVPSVVQNGPSCGLAALCMALKMLSSGTNADGFDTDFILQKAKQLNYTKQGEMFSAENLSSLASQLVPCRGTILQNGTEKDKTSIHLVDAIVRGSAILVPYDRDANNEPCLKRGRKAHWALITGLVFVTNRSVLEQLSDKSTICENEIMQNLFHADLDKTKKFALDFLPNISAESLYVYAVQGKSIRTHLWRLGDLLSSNGQLKELDPEVEACIKDFVVDIDGVATGLCNKIVILTKMFNSVDGSSVNS